MTEQQISEDRLAAKAMAAMLSSVLLKAYDEPRRFLYIWEREALQWLIRFRERDPTAGFDDWTGTFMRLNHDAIMDPDGKMDFNLKAFTQREASKA